jgi:hypothetical protein
MFYTGLDPYTLEPVYVPRTPKEKAMQRALLQYFNPKNKELVAEALIKAHRTDLFREFGINDNNYARTNMPQKQGGTKWQHAGKAHHGKR